LVNLLSAKNYCCCDLASSAFRVTWAIRDAGIAANKKPRSAMSETDDLPKPERVPFFQRLLDNPFLLLFLGIVMPTVFYILWGVMEIATLPIAP
jgi:hypothetical protein